MFVNSSGPSFNPINHRTSPQLPESTQSSDTTSSPAALDAIQSTQFFPVKGRRIEANTRYPEFDTNGWECIAHQPATNGGHSLQYQLKAEFNVSFHDSNDIKVEKTALAFKKFFIELFPATEPGIEQVISRFAEDEEASAPFFNQLATDQLNTFFESTDELERSEQFIALKKILEERHIDYFNPLLMKKIEESFLRDDPEAMGECFAELEQTLAEANKKVFIESLKSGIAPPPMYCTAETLKELGFSYHINEKGFIVWTVPDLEALTVNWEKKREQEPNLPKLKFVLEKGALSHRAFIRGNINSDGLCAVGKQGLHDLFFHLLCVFDQIYSETNPELRTKSYESEKQRVNAIISSLDDKIEEAHLNHVESKELNLVEAVLGATVDNYKACVSCKDSEDDASLMSTREFDDGLRTETGIMKILEVMGSFFEKEFPQYTLDSIAKTWANFCSKTKAEPS